MNRARAGDGAGPFVWNRTSPSRPIARLLRYYDMNKRLWRVTFLAGLLFSTLPGCARTPAADPQPVALEAAIQRWLTAVNAQDVVTLSTAMTVDVELSDGAVTVKGRDAAIRALGELATHGRLVATSREISLANEVAWHVVGLSQIQKNGDVKARGQALEIWMQVEGEWRVHRRLLAEVVTAELSLTRPATNEPVLDRPRN